LSAVAAGYSLRRLPDGPDPPQADLDALKAAGLNSDEISRRLLDQHQRGERMDVQRAIAQKVGRRS
jgi:hypothetical protein